MQKLILTFTIIFVTGFSSNIFGQGKSDSSMVKYTYPEIIGRRGLLSNKFDTSLDFGQEGGSISFDEPIRDVRNSTTKTFNSMIDALNYMCDNGWDFVQAYTIHLGNGKSDIVYHYVIRKKK